MEAITAAARARIAFLCGAHRSGRSTALLHWAELATTPTIVCSERTGVLDALGEIASRSRPSDTTVVVDDIDTIFTLEDLPELLDALELAPHARLVGAVGWDGLWFAEALAMSSEVATVDDRVLAFDETEVRQLMHDRGVAPSAVLVADALRTFAGWPPVVRAMSAVLQFEGFGDARTIEDELRFTERIREVMTTGLARRLTPAAVEALAPLSLVSQCSAAAAARILGCDDDEAAVILAELDEVGLGSWRFVNGRRRFRISAVTRGIVAPSKVRSATDRRLHGRIALELAVDRSVGDAVRHALLSDDADVVERVLDGTFPDGLRSDPHQFETACRDAVRRELVQSVDIRALTDLVQWHVTGAGPLAPCDRVGSTEEPAPRDPLLDVAEAVRQLCAGSVEIARGLAFRADKAAGRYAALTALTRAQVLMHAAPLTHEVSESKAVIGTFREVVAAHPGTEAAFAAAGYIALLKCLDGDVADARHELLRVPTGLALRWEAGPWGRARRLANAWLALEGGEENRAATTAEEIRRGEWGSDRCFAAVVEATARLHAGDLQGAARVARASLCEPKGPQGPRVRDLLEAVRLDVSGGRRDAPQGAVLFAVISRAASSQLAMARCSLRRGDVHEAFASATTVLRSAELTTRNRVDALLLVGAASCRSGLRHEAQRAVLEAAAECTRQGLTTPWYFVAPDVLETAETVLDAESRRVLTAGPRLPTGTVVPELTPRELVVLETRARSGSLREVAARLIVSPNTVKTQLHSAYRKLGVSSASQAVARAIDLGVIVDPDSLRRNPGAAVARGDRRRVG
ncbi:LuxR C-terminal-related transcriptional regulator [Curtobacterium pusillum]|uniref:LuxR C-terminal-related transcriptional regulator n=1 Tax=Curtobacterium pusillum TaxID=69373 RepID=UPI001642F081|nr:LuxR C-terminal-related transcriptional regulator [Curtobacterium pusillum]